MVKNESIGSFMDKLNPYIGRGKPVTGERLVGRVEVIRRLMDRIVNSAHCSIVGLPRMGKTSIAKEIINSVSKRSTLRFNCGYLTLDSISGPSQAYEKIVSELFSNLDEEITDFKKNLNHDESYEQALKFLRQLKRKNIQSILIFDEFDAILRTNFTDSQLFISRVREIANDFDKFNITFLFISRRPLDYIQGEIDCSTLAGLCEVIYLKPLSEAGLTELVNRSPIRVTESGFEALWHFTGGNPYLAEVLMCETLENKHSIIDKNSIEQAMETQAHEFVNQYLLLEKILSHDGMFDSLCELTVGPYWRNISQRTICLLKNYGLIKNSDAPENELVCMSKHLQEYLMLRTREQPTWEILGEVERLLRVVIRDKFESKYGRMWFDKIVKKHKNLEEIYKRLAQQKSYERKIFGNAAPDNILDYSYTKDLKEILFSEWELFLPYLSDTKEDWEKRFKDILLVRNRLAHHRPIPSDAVRNAENACLQLLRKLKGEQI